MKNLSLKLKLVISFLLAGLIPLISIGIYSYYQTSEALYNMADDKLVAVRNIKGDAVRRYFEGIRDQVLTFSHDVMVEDAMVEFSAAFDSYTNELEVSEADLIVFKDNLKNFYQNEFGKKYQSENGESANELSFLSQLSPVELALQYNYIGNNENPLGSKEQLDFAADGTKYSNLHEKYHPSIREFLQKFGYYDIFLVDIDSGHIVYSVFKELDYATSLLTGPYKNTNFADAFRKAREINDQSSFVLVDYKKYTPSYEAPASFIASPIWNNGEKVGVAIFQMPIDRLNAIMNDRSGMGETGETYLFGPDRLMRSDSFLDNENYNVVSSFKKPDTGMVTSPGVDAAISGKKGNKITTNYLGQKVISAYTPIDILGLKWGLIAEIHTEEALAPSVQIRNALFIMIGVSIGLIVLFAFYLSSSLSKKIQSIAVRLIERAKAVGESSTKISSSSQQLSESATEAAASLQETVSSIDEISSMIQRNADAAKSSTDVSKRSNEAANLGKSTVESMMKSINEISGSSDEIAEEMHKNNQDISKIVEVISEIGERTKVINDIVFQTKLLSFNASVEAARAGEHGKGFAVVAEEVGNLAAMSGKAALEITEMLDRSIKHVTEIVENTKKKVEVLVSDSKEKVESGTTTATECNKALDEILVNVTSVNEMVREIATASAEQSSGVQEVTRAMQQLDQTTHQNTTVAQESSQMASQLMQQADGLNSVVGELMEVVTGDSNYQIEQRYPDGGSTQGDLNANVLSLNKDHKRKEVLQTQQNQSLKVAGLDTEIPREDDPRFEDL